MRLSTMNDLNVNFRIGNPIFPKTTFTTSSVGKTVSQYSMLNVPKI